MTESVAVSEIFASKGRSGKDGIIIITRMLQLQATVKRFQFDLYVNLEGQHMLISSWFQKYVSQNRLVNQTAQSTVKSSNFYAFGS